MHDCRLEALCDQTKNVSQIRSCTNPDKVIICLIKFTQQATLPNSDFKFQELAQSVIKRNWVKTCV